MNLNEINNTIFILVSEAARYCYVHWLSRYQRYCRQSANLVFPVSALAYMQLLYIMLNNRNYYKKIYISYIKILAKTN